MLVVGIVVCLSAARRFVSPSDTVVYIYTFDFEFHFNLFFVISGTLPSILKLDILQGSV